MILIYITNPSKEEAKKIAKHLLEKKLIACANIFPINSMYWWKGKIADEDEFVLIAKTTADKFASVRAEVEKIHPYEVPCIIKLEADANEEYLKWLKEEIDEGAD